VSHLAICPTDTPYIPYAKSYYDSRLRKSVQRIHPRPCITFRNKLFFYGEQLLVPRPLPSWKTNLCGIFLYFSLFPVTPTSERRASVKRFVSLQFLNRQTVSRTPWTGDQHVTRPLPTHRTTKTQNKRSRTSLSWVGSEPTIPAFKRTKTIHALDRAATVIGTYSYRLL
jgi:hypothetical protein